MNVRCLIVAGIVNLFASTDNNLNADPNSNLNIDSKDHYLDFGGIVEQSQVSHNFELINGFSHSVKIISIDKSCGCTNASINKMLVSPGDRAELSVTLTPELTGGIRSLIAIEWKTVELPEVTGHIKIWLYANVLTLLNYDPKIFDLGILKTDSGPVSLEVHISRGLAAVKWNQIQINSNVLKIKQKQIDHNTYLITASIDPTSITTSAFRDEIDIKLLQDGNILPYDYQVPVLGKIESDVVIKPSSLYLGLISSIQQRRGQIEVIARNGLPLQLISVQSSNPNFITLKLNKKASTPPMLVFDYETQPNVRAGVKSGLLTVRITSDKERDVSLPFMAYVSGDAMGVH